MVREFKKIYLEENLEVRLVRKLGRWDLRSHGLYSTASAFDVTYLAKGNIYEHAFFKLKRELQGERVLFLKSNSTFYSRM